jgi:hypothetical protein
MKDTFTTPEIEQLPLQLQRGRIKEWVASGYITPSVQKGKGSGTKHVFSRDDLYAIVLLRDLIDCGVSRKLASSIVKDFFYDLSSFSRALKNRTPYLIVSRVTEPGKEPEVHTQLNSEIPTSLKSTFLYQWAFNLENIKLRVDEVVE